MSPKELVAEFLEVIRYVPTIAVAPQGVGKTPGI